jgi:transcription termination/antitermination protein NusG
MERPPQEFRATDDAPEEERPGEGNDDAPTPEAPAAMDPDGREGSVAALSTPEAPETAEPGAAVATDEDDLGVAVSQEAPVGEDQGLEEAEPEPDQAEPPATPDMESPAEEPVAIEELVTGEEPPAAEGGPVGQAGEPEALEPAADLVEVVEEEGEPVAAVAQEPSADGDRGRDPFRGPGDWYVVHTYAGYENKVKANLMSRIHSMQMEDKIFDVHIPMEDVMEIKGGKKQVVQRKVFPGYLLVKMLYDNDSWYVVRNTPGVTGFVSSGTGTKPTPLSRREVEKILAVKKEEAKPHVRLEFEEGDTVRIISGPFADFNGHISDINVDQSKLKVLVNIFDRETPVELGFDQVAKV